MTSQPDQTSRFGNWISEGWKMFTEQWQMWVLLSLGSLLVFALPLAALTVGIFLAAFAGAATQAGGRGGVGPDLTVFAVLAGTMLMILVLMPLTAFLTGGMYRSAFKQLRGGRLEFRDLFSVGNRYLPVLGATILLLVMQMIGGMMCVIPGLIVAGLFIFTIPLIVERGLGVFEAMRTSFELTKQRLFMFTLFALIVQLIVSAGSYLCYIGILATYPLMFTMTAAAYRDCFGLSGSSGFLSTAAPPQISFKSESPDVYAPRAVRPSTCPICQAPLPASATFCPRCGARVE